MGESGGKYARIVRRFERWLSKCQDVLEARSRDDEVEDIIFLEELDFGLEGRLLNAWKEIGHLER